MLSLNIPTHWEIQLIRPPLGHEILVIIKTVTKFLNVIGYQQPDRTVYTCVMLVIGQCNRTVCHACVIVQYASFAYMCCYVDYIGFNFSCRKSQLFIFYSQRHLTDGYFLSEIVHSLHYSVFQ